VPKRTRKVHQCHSCTYNAPLLGAAPETRTRRLRDKRQLGTDAVNGQPFSGGFKPGPGRRHSSQFCFSLPSFVATRIFLVKITQVSDVFAFPNCRKLGKFAVSIERPKTKSTPVSVGALPPDQMFCPWTLLGALPPDFHYRLVLPRSPWVPAPCRMMLRARTATAAVATCHIHIYKCRPPEKNAIGNKQLHECAKIQNNTQMHKIDVPRREK